MDGDLTAAERILARHAVDYVDMDDMAVCVCQERFLDVTFSGKPPEGEQTHPNHQVEKLREAGLL